VRDEARVCPFCGEPPGTGMFCERCGRNLADVEQLPTRPEWERRSDASGAPTPGARSVRSVEAFLAAMRAAGDPGVVRLPESQPGFLGRKRHAEGWIVRPVARDETSPSRRYTAGVFVTTAGRVRRLESATRGWGQRTEPRHIDTVGPELDGSQRDDEALLVDLTAVLGAHGVGVA